MNALDLIKDKVAYNQWANQKIVEWLNQQEADLYEEKVISSFPTINKLMHHLMEAEKYYYSILRQEVEEYEEEMTTEKIFEELLSMDKGLVSWLALKNEDFMDKEISLKRSPFVETYTTATLITHMVNHSTYHRGQVIGLRHQLGISDPPRTDYYRYFIALSQQG